MRLLITGATGNIGTALLRQLRLTFPSWDVDGVCRRPPESGRAEYDRVTWHALDLTSPHAADRLALLCSGVDAVVHLAWAIQPTHDPAYLEAVNVQGSKAVMSAVRDSGVRHLVCASSVGAYAPATDKPYVNEGWPTRALPTSIYSRHKVAVEHALDGLQAYVPDLVITRLRPGLVFQGDAARALTRYFVGPLGATLPVLRHVRLPVLPLPRGLLLPVVHSDDVAEGILRVLQRRLAGPLNLAADSPVSGPDLAAAVHSRAWELSPALVRRVVHVSWLARAQPTDAGWFDLAMTVPLLDTDRARRELDWRPRHSAGEALSELLVALGEQRGGDTPVLARGGRHRSDSGG